jgi:glycosyltransferase involved in cell wall biosynthesis
MVRNAVLTEAYTLADLLIMPSLQETVGLPMLEAMNAGTPVLAADRPYAREICQDAASFFDPTDAGDLAFRIEALLADVSLRQALSRKGRDITLKRRTLEPYRKLLNVAAEAVVAFRGGI